MTQKRLPAACAALCLALALAGCGGAASSAAPAPAPSSSQPAAVSSAPAEASSLPEAPPAPDYPTFEAEGYTVAYRVIPPEEVAELNQDSIMIGPKEGDIDPAAAKAVLVEFVSATQNGEEAKVDTAMREISTGRLKFIIDGAEYRTNMIQTVSQSGGLSGGFKIVCTWFAVPLDTPDLPSLEITYE